MTALLRLLLLEDNPADAELNEHILRKAGLEFETLRVEDAATYIAALDSYRQRDSARTAGGAVRGVSST